MGLQEPRQHLSPPEKLRHKHTQGREVDGCDSQALAMRTRLGLDDQSALHSPHLVQIPHSSIASFAQTKISLATDVRVDYL